MAKGNKGKQQQQQANGSAAGAGAAKSPSTNGHHSKASSLLTASDDEHTESADYDEISSNSAQNQPDDDIDHEKVEAFRRIASAEEIEEMSN